MKSWMLAHRVLIGIVAIVVVVLAGGLYVVSAAARVNGPGGGSAVAPISGDLLYIDVSNGQDQVHKTTLTSPDGPKVALSLRCQRIYAAAGNTVCLRLAGLGPAYEAAVFDSSGKELRAVGLAGIPSRARISGSGQVVSWTAFVTGDSYSVPGGFSTRTGVLDLRSGELIESLEGFTAIVEGQVKTAADRNFWGVTVASDDRTFYATMASANRTWLMKGDLVTKTMQDVRPTAECPSLSPDGTKIAYKKRTKRLGPWELTVLDLKTGAEHGLPGTEGIDDQAVWLDESRLAYGKVTAGSLSAIYAVPADGKSQPELLIADALSPVPVK